MEMGKELRKCALGVAVVLLAAAGALRAQDRPLPEVAKQKSAKTASRVITDEDLEASRPPEASPAAAALPVAAGKDSGPRITIPGLLEQATLSQARATLESLKHDQEVLQRRYAQIQEKLSSGTDEHLRKLYSGSLARRDETLARKRRQIEAVEKAIEAAESRRASSPRSEHEGATGVEK
ncbi:MAG TPA: hypothetical protein VGR48_08380 [Terriglobales bacterium]|nr:hypothetical protein [Terriglobales bacterium]